MVVRTLQNESEQRASRGTQEMMRPAGCTRKVSNRAMEFSLAAWIDIGKWRSRTEIAAGAETFIVSGAGND
jgi:hypothetical protein